MSPFEFHLSSQVGTVDNLMPFSLGVTNSSLETIVADSDLQCHLFSELEAAARSGECVAVGECGLDFNRNLPILINCS
jgi:hypothetical protein